VTTSDPKRRHRVRSEENGSTSTALKSFATWAAVAGITLASLAALCLVVWHFLHDPDLFRTIMVEHVRAVVGIPMAAVSAFCVLLIFEARSGQVEFEALGFRFRGASGPAVIWVFSFLSFAGVIRLLW